MVIFGATGDLASTELLPSLFELYCKRLLPERFAIVGFARREWSTEHFRQVARQAIEDECAWEPEAWNDFARRLSYVQGDATGPPEEGYAELKAGVEVAAAEFDIPEPSGSPSPGSRPAKMAGGASSLKSRSGSTWRARSSSTAN
jgi:glucose-6-phosphate 1-dehydrogenase